MQEKSGGLVEFFRDNWWQICVLIVIVIRIYISDGEQTKRIDEHDARIIAIEQKQNLNDTNWAVINVKLTQIQADLTEIKTQRAGHEK